MLTEQRSRSRAPAFNFFLPAPAVCLDGSPPAYHLHRGSGAGTRNWLLQFEGGGWCNDVPSCAERAGTRRGSTRLMTKVEFFSGILSNRPAMNPGILYTTDGPIFSPPSEFSFEAARQTNQTYLRSLRSNCRSHAFMFGRVSSNSFAIHSTTSRWQQTAYVPVPGGTAYFCKR